VSSDGLRDIRNTGPYPPTISFRSLLPTHSAGVGGFVLYGAVGIEIPTLREWLNRYKPGPEAGIFQTMFVGYHTANDDVLRFMLDEGDPITGRLMGRVDKGSTPTHPTFDR
jgi:hypothetical protein